MDDFDLLDDLDRKILSVMKEKDSVRNIERQLNERFESTSSRKIVGRMRVMKRLGLVTSGYYIGDYEIADPLRVMVIKEMFLTNYGPTVDAFEEYEEREKLENASEMGHS